MKCLNHIIPMMKFQEMLKKEICLGNKVFKVTDVPLKDINSFYSELDSFIQTTEKKF